MEIFYLGTHGIDESTLIIGYNVHNMEFGEVEEFVYRGVLISGSTNKGAPLYI